MENRKESRVLRLIAFVVGVGTMFLLWPVVKLLADNVIAGLAWVSSGLGVGVVWQSTITYLGGFFPVGVMEDWVESVVGGVGMAILFFGLGCVALAVASHFWFVRQPPFVMYEKMPALRPIPIYTKNVGWPRNLKRWIFDPRQWELVEDWECRLGDATIVIRADEHFAFDGASIPRPLWFLLSPVGLLLMPGLLHDYAYRFDQLHCVLPQNAPYQLGAGKLYWDKLFLRSAVDINGFRMLNTLASYAVVLGGYFAWWSHRKETKKPRILGLVVVGCVIASFVFQSGLPIACLVMGLLLIAIVVLVRFEFFTDL